MSKKGYIRFEILVRIQTSNFNRSRDFEMTKSKIDLNEYI